MYRVERERESPNYPANTLLTYFINSESLSILPLSESKNETLHKYSYVILLFLCLEFYDLMWVLNSWPNYPLGGDFVPYG